MMLIVGLHKPQLLWLVFPGLFFATFIWSRRREKPCSRSEVKRLASTSGLVFGLLSAGGFAATVLAYPGTFEIPTASLPAVSLFLGLGGGLAILIVSLCALDTAGIQ